MPMPMDSCGMYCCFCTKARQCCQTCHYLGLPCAVAWKSSGILITKSSDSLIWIAKSCFKCRFNFRVVCMFLHRGHFLGKISFGSVYCMDLVTMCPQEWVGALCKTHSRVLRMRFGLFLSLPFRSWQVLWQCRRKEKTLCYFTSLKKKLALAKGGHVEERSVSAQVLTSQYVAAVDVFNIIFVSCSLSLGSRCQTSMTFRAMSWTCECQWLKTNLVKLEGHDNEHKSRISNVVMESEQISLHRVLNALQQLS